MTTNPMNPQGGGTYGGAPPRPATPATPFEARVMALATRQVPHEHTIAAGVLLDTLETALAVGRTVLKDRCTSDNVVQLARLLYQIESDLIADMGGGGADDGDVTQGGVPGGGGAAHDAGGDGSAGLAAPESGHAPLAR